MLSDPSPRILRLALGALVIATALGAAPALATPILAPGDPILGGARVAGSFEVGVAGTTAGANNWPGAEPPEDLINGIIGGPGDKYLNFARLDTGVIVTPTAGPSVATSIEFFVANDVPDRDPASFELWGTNASLGGGPFDIAALFTPIATGPLALPDARDLVADATGNSQVVSFTNTTAYTSYLLLFPTVKGASNSMQLSEVRLDGSVPEPSLPVLVLVGISLLGVRRGRDAR